MAEKKKKIKDPTVLKFWAIWNATEALLITLAGILSIIVGAVSIASPDEPNMQEIADTLTTMLPFVVGAFVVMDAAMRVIISFTKFRKESNESSMLLGAFEGTVGVVLMIHFSIFVELVADFLSIFMILVGVMLIVFSVFAIIKSRAKLFVPILEIVFASALIAIGVAVLIVYYRSSADAERQRLVLIIIGSVLAISGVTFLIMTLISRKKTKKEYVETMAPQLDAEDEKPEEIVHEKKPEAIEKNDKPDVIDCTENAGELPPPEDK